MCAQHVEISLVGILLLHNVKLMMGGNWQFFTSRCLLMAEICYKLEFFWGMYLIACGACCNFGQTKCGYSLLASSAIMAWGIVDHLTSVWTTLLAVYSSLVVLRGALFRAFLVVMYPSMGMRCLI